MTAVAGLLLAGCQAETGAYNVSSLTDVYPHPAPNGLMASVPMADTGSNAFPNFTSGTLFTTSVVSGGPAMAKVPASSAQGMPESVNSLPVGAVASN